MSVGTLTLRWPGILIGLLFMVVVLTACSDSTESTPTINGGSGAWEEYEAFCSEAAQTELDDNEDYTNGEVATFYAGLVERMESIDPPAEIADWHYRVLSGWEAVTMLFDAEPEDEIADPIMLFLDTEILSLFGAVEEAFDEMPADVRERLAAAGCGETDPADSQKSTGEGESDARQPDAASGSAKTDREALVALYNATDGENWSNNTNWLSDVPLDEWEGILVDYYTGRVVWLHLGENALSGEIPAELGSLSNLEQLHLDENALSGEIPAELGSLSNLAWLLLGDNALSGEIPAELGSLSNLAWLLLDSNELSGEIPAELGSLSNLVRLDLARNQLSGEIPEELGSLSNLVGLDLEDNALSGEIPAELGNLPNLQRLDLARNQLSGEIPVELGKIPNPKLDGNQLSGRILRPNGTNPQYAWDGSTIRVSWDAVEGADSYTVYHDYFRDDSCELGSDGSPSRCEELATNVVDTSYVHADPASGENYYWVVSCNSDGCSDIDSRFPAHPIDSDPVEAEPVADSSTATPRDTPTPAPNSTPTGAPTPTPIPTPTDTPTPTPSPTPTPIPVPKSPTNVRYALDGSTIRVSWDPVAGADSYTVYHYDVFPDCRVGRDGRPSFCEELATDVVDTSYVHADPASGENYYWVVACNRGGCSDVDSENPAAPIEAKPTRPTNVRYALDGSTIRVSWDPVAGADSYTVYHDDVFPDVCLLGRDGSPSFCEELATDVVDTSYVHADPDSVKNYYWVVACNRGGCSDIDSENPAKPE